jgi:two-component system sensor histidine kinase VicK
MNLVSSDSPVYRPALRDQWQRRQTIDPTAACALWTSERGVVQRAQQTQAQLMTMLVHELRSPAAASKSMVATFRFLHRQDSHLDSFLAKIEDRMDQLLSLVDDILTLSQAKAEHWLGSHAVLDLVAETRKVCRPYVEEAAAKGLAMSVKLLESPVRVHVAEGAYQLIVSNLVSNAVKYTSIGSVRVSLREEGAWAVLTVQDTGIGIPPDEIRYLSNEFYRASNARTSPMPGTGLGLAAVKALVEGCHGELHVRSRENRGSRFTVRLPLCTVSATQEIASHMGAEREVQ